MKPKTIYPRLLQLSAVLFLLPLGMHAQTFPVTHIDRPDEVHFQSTTAGAVVYNSANASGGVSPLNPLLLGTAPDSQYKWSFSFQIPEDKSGRPVIIRLDNGNADPGRLIAGITINASGQLGYMTNPNNGSLSSQMTYLTDGPALLEETWYDVTFLFTTPMIGESMGIAYDLTIPGIIDEAITVSYVPNALNSETALRHALSYQTANGGTDINVRDVSLQTIAIPEPAALPVLLIVGGILIGLHLRKRNRA